MTDRREGMLTDHLDDVRSVARQMHTPALIKQQDDGRGGCLHGELGFVVDGVGNLIILLCKGEGAPDLWCDRGRDAELGQHLDLFHGILDQWSILKVFTDRKVAP